MDTLSVDLLGLIATKLDATESELFSILSIDVFNVSIEISVNEAIRKQDFRVLRYFVQNRAKYTDQVRTAKIAKYLVVYSNRYDQEIDSLMKSLVYTDKLITQKLIEGVIIANNFQMLIYTIAEAISQYGESFEFEMNKILATAIKYKRINMIDYITGLGFGYYLKHLIIGAKFNGDIGLLDLIMSKNLFFIQDYNDEMRIMAESNDVIGMKYFLDKGATNLDECEEIGWDNHLPDVIDFCIKHRNF